MTTTKKRPPGKKAKVTDKHEVFLERYLANGFNATNAAIAAGYAPGSAYTVASRILKLPHVRARVNKVLTELALPAEEVLARLADHARATIAHFVQVNQDGSIHFDFSTTEARANMHLIKTVRTRRRRLVTGTGKGAQEWEEENVEVTLHDPQKALELIGKHLKLFSDRFELGGPLVIDGLDYAIEKIYGPRLDEKKLVEPVDPAEEEAPPAIGDQLEKLYGTAHKQ